MVVPRLWVGVKEAAQATGRKQKTIYEQIRTGTFPFEVRRAGTAILISARDLGLFPLTNENRGDEPQTEPRAASATS
jgi:hypothetical protein